MNNSIYRETLFAYPLTLEFIGKLTLWIDDKDSQFWMPSICKEKHLSQTRFARPSFAEYPNMVRFACPTRPRAKVLEPHWVEDVIRVSTAEVKDFLSVNRKELVK